MTALITTAEDLADGPFDLIVTPGEVRLLDGCPRCGHELVTPIPAGDALLGAAQLSDAAARAEAAEVSAPAAPVLRLFGVVSGDERLVDGPNGGA